MPVLNLCRHRGRTYRKTETTGTVFREPTRTWAVHVPSFRCEVQVRRENREDRQAGEIRAGEYNVYDPEQSHDIVPGDVFETTSGDKHPLTLEVIEVDAQRGNHLELRCVDWEGSLT
jgi:hypothetical protein